MTHGINWRDEVGKVENVLINVVETKVKATTTAATIVGFASTLLGAYVFHGVVPEWAIAGIGSIVTGGLTFLAGWIAKHTPRVLPDPPVAPGSTDPAPAPGSPPVPPAAA